jgi:hypothetical protein
VLKHLVGVDEQDLEDLATRFLAKRLGRMGFSQACRPADQHVAFLAHIVPGGEGQDLLPTDGGAELEVEGLQR